MKSSELKFSSPVLIECNFSVNFDFDKEAKKVKILQKFELGFGPKNKEKRSCNVMLKVILGSKDIAPFEMTVSMLANFRWSEKVDGDSDDILRRNAPEILLGYIRPIVANLTNNSPYPVYNIPVVDFDNIQIISHETKKEVLK